MTSELKPCPFCGGKATIQIFDNIANVGCPECRIMTRFIHVDDIEGVEGVMAWNARAERTCRNVYDEEIGACFNGFKCSECGETVSDCEGYRVNGTWNYCPRCMARVVD